MSGRIPQQFIDDLIARVDIVDVIDERVPLKKAGKDYKACCPFHGEKTPSFTVSRDKQFYHCFGCGAHGTAIGFLMEYAHLDFPDAIRELASRAGMAMPEHGGEQGPNLQPIHDILGKAAEFFRHQFKADSGGQRAAAYLRDRGLSGRIAARFGLGYAPEGWDRLLTALGTDENQVDLLRQAGLVVDKDKGRHYDRFRDRVMFPILDRRGRTVGFGGRVLGEGTPKYLNSPETPVFHKGRELYGLYQAREAKGHLEQLLVVEGYMDVVALAQFGISYAVATLGTAATREQIEQMFRASPAVVFCFDGDAAGRKAAWRALENALPLLAEGRQVRYMFLPEGEDPDSLVRARGQANFEAYLARAVPLSEYFFQQMTGQVEMTSLDGRARLVELARPYLTDIPVGAFRTLMIQRLSELSRLPREDLAQLIANPAQAAPRPVPRPRRSTQGPSLMRKTIALLLHHPGLARQAPEPEAFARLNVPGAELLASMLDLIARNPNITLAGLLEHYRNTPHGAHLARLAEMEELKAEGIDPAREILDGFERIQLRSRELRFDHLQEKERHATLSPEEKQEYFELFKRLGGLSDVPDRT